MFMNVYEYFDNVIWQFIRMSCLFLNGIFEKCFLLEMAKSFSKHATNLSFASLLPAAVTSPNNMIKSSVSGWSIVLLRDEESSLR